MVRTNCEDALIAPAYFPRPFSLKTANWDDNMSLIGAQLTSNSWGSVRSYFSQAWDTQVYYTATGTPYRDDMSVPLVDPICEKVVLYIHGSGTTKTSGRNFVGNMTDLSRSGYCAVSVDLPFHMSGSLNDKMNSNIHFMKWLKTIVDELAKAGKPIFMTGHSFGPDVIFEFMSRYPFALSGALAISPGGIDSVTDAWYVSHTSKMRFGGNVATNVLGSEWAGRISAQEAWKRYALPDPTVVNPDLNLVIMYGDREEYIPAPVGGPNRTPIGKNTYDIAPVLHSHFKNATIVVEPGIGHYIFDHEDSLGQNAVQRETFKMLGISLIEAKNRIILFGRQREERPAYERLASRYATDLMFRAWALKHHSERMIHEIFRNQDARRAQTMLAEFTLADEARDKELMQMLNNTQTTDPEFYQANKSRIDFATEKGRLDAGLFGLYYKYKNGPPIGLN